MEYEIALTGILIVMQVFIATFESAFGHLSEVALRSLAADSRNKHASFLRHILEHRQIYWLSVISGLQVAIVSITLLLASIAMRFGLGHMSTILAAFGVSLII